jgi:hypothetical protein
MSPIIAGVFGLGIAELIVVMLIVFTLFFVFSGVPAVLAYVVLKRVPPPFRKQDPALAFLLLIPFFSLIWSFFVHPKVAESLKAYSEAQGITDGRDCGGALALWLCICGVCVFVPIVGFVAGIAALVLLIVFYIKAFELSARLPKSMA